MIPEKIFTLKSIVPSMKLLNLLKTTTSDYAILPIENTTSGSINDVYDALTTVTFTFVGEEIFPVKHCLLAIEDVPINNIKKVFTHYQAARQCSKFLKSIPNAEVELITRHCQIC